MNLVCLAVLLVKCLLNETSPKLRFIWLGYCGPYVYLFICFHTMQLTEKWQLSKQLINFMLIGN